MDYQKVLKAMKPIQILVLGYIAIVVVGSLVLRMPVSSKSSTPQVYIDALFTSTSAVSTTGLIVVDTHTFYSFFGQIIILLLFQIGGLGYMVFVVLMVYAVGKKPSLVSAVTLQESLSGVTLGNMKKFLKAVIMFTILFEGIGAFFLFLAWRTQFPMDQSVYLSIFHSVSAFCTSGFSLFSDSFVEYQMNWGITMVLSLVSIAGGLGFIVLTDIQNVIIKRIKNVRPRYLSLHTKLTLTMTLILIAGGILIMAAAESGPPVKERIALAVFQSVSASSTTGFNSVDIGGLQSTSLFFIIILMFIGASPGGSGGGIKVTAFGSMALLVASIMRRKEDVTIFKKRIPSEIVRRSFVIGFLMLAWVITVTLVLTATEKGEFLDILFEVVSAAGTVGLSTGITGSLTGIGKFLIIVTMFIGRVGPLAAAFSLIGETKPVAVKYAEGQVYIG
ncbi:MAG: potassium transporter TrkG [Candidatus Methanofastidiosia archaeon]|jgi:trk system potassium uptake protein TrkH